MLRQENDQEEVAAERESKASDSPHRLLQAQPQLREEDRVIINIWPSEKNKAVPGLNVGHVSLETPGDYISLWPAPRDPHQARRLPPAAFAKLKRSWNRYFKMRPPLWKPSYIEDCVSEAICEEHCREIDNPGQCYPHERVVALSEAAGLVLLEPGAMFLEDEEIDLLVAVTPAQATVRLALYGLKVGPMHEEFQRLQEKTPGWQLAGSNFFTRLAGQPSKENCASLVYRLLVAGGAYKGRLAVRGSSDTSSAATPDTLIKHIILAKRREIHQHPETRGWVFAGESSLAALEQAHGMKSVDGNRREAAREASAQMSKPSVGSCSLM
jgi:hypothetical protein